MLSMMPNYNKKFFELKCDIDRIYRDWEYLEEKFENLKVELDEVVGKDVKRTEEVTYEIVMNRKAIQKLDEEYAEIKPEIDEAYRHSSNWPEREYYEIPEEELDDDLRLVKAKTKNENRRLNEN